MKTVAKCENSRYAVASAEVTYHKLNAYCASPNAPRTLSMLEGMVTELGKAFSPLVSDPDSCK